MIRKFAAFLVILIPAAVFAFPSTPILEQCNRTEDPIAGIWTNGVTGTGQCGCDGDELGGTSGTDDCYITQTYPSVQEIYFTMATGSSFGEENNQYAFMCLQQIGAGTVDGYGVRFRRQTAANDTLQMFRMTNGTLPPTNLGTPYQSVEFADGDKVGMRIEPGGTLRLYFNDGGAGWVEVDTVTGETTYTCTGTNIGFRLSEPGNLIDDIGGGGPTGVFSIIQAR